MKTVLIYVCKHTIAALKLLSRATGSTRDHKQKVMGQPEFLPKLQIISKGSKIETLNVM